MERRSFLRIGLSTLAAGVASTHARAAGGLARGTAASAATRAAPKARACIVLYMNGGASHIDTFDPKPGTDTGGSFAAIPTALTGVRISEHLPRLAARLDRLTVVRSLTAREGNHDRARHLMHTGYAPAGGTDYPSMGAHVAAARGETQLPPYVAIGGGGHGAGFLGAAHGPFVVPNADKPMRLMKDAARVDAARRARRAGIWRGQQDAFGAEHASPQVAGHNGVLERALTMLDGTQMQAFELDREPSRVAGAYGTSAFGRGCLLARRLVEAGVPFIEVGMKGWDTHDDNFERVRALSGPLDEGMAALLDDLEVRGLLDETLVVWAGDFGRTPRINARGGRDHWPQAQSAVLAGAGLDRGRVLGATDAEGYEVTDDPFGVPDLMATIAGRMGLDPDRTLVTDGGRPLQLVDAGQPL